MSLLMSLLLLSWSGKDYVGSVGNVGKFGTSSSKGATDAGTCVVLLDYLWD